MEGNGDNYITKQLLIYSAQLVLLGQLQKINYGKQNLVELTSLND